MHTLCFKTLSHATQSMHSFIVSYDVCAFDFISPFLRPMKINALHKFCPHWNRILFSMFAIQSKHFHNTAAFIYYTISEEPLVFNYIVFDTPTPSPRPSLLIPSVHHEKCMSVLGSTSQNIWPKTTTKTPITNGKSRITACHNRIQIEIVSTVCGVIVPW